MKKLIEKLKIKDLKTLLKIVIIVAITNVISLIFFFVSKMNLTTYYNFLFTISFFVFGFAYIYGNRKIHKIRKKTKNWDKPLSDEEKKTYLPTLFVCYYASFFNMVIYLLVYIIELLVQ